jgi:hypothetical protein
MPGLKRKVMLIYAVSEEEVRDKLTAESLQKAKCKK